MAVVKIDASFERLTNVEAAQYLGISIHTLDSWRCLKKPFIPYLKIGRLVFYRRSDLDEFIEAGVVES
jgi:excisionase family DNA binding protein